MTKEYNFLEEKQKCYSPKQMGNWLNNSALLERGNIQKLFDNKHKYGKLIECWHACIYALAIKKRLGFEFLICPSDKPDIHFLNKKGVNTNQQEGFQVEIRELFKKDDFDDDYEKLVEEIWKSKGKKRYGKCHLLLASRLITKGFKLKRFVDFINDPKYSWAFERIILSVFTKTEKEWTFFEIFPCPLYPKIGKMSFSLRNDNQYWY